MGRYLNLSRVLLALALLALLLSGPAAAEPYRFSTEQRVVAVGDIHGARDEFVAVLQGAGLVDEQLAWSGGATTLVSVGDLVDRGDHGRQVMDLVMRLQGEAAAAGGAVHVVLGNHEAMNLSGDLRYVSEGDYAQFGDQAAAGLPAGFRERRAAFAPDGEYGRWLHELPVAIVVNDTLFVHGGVSKRLEGRSLEEINVAARRDLHRFVAGWEALLEAGQLAEGDDFGDIRTRAAALAQGAGDARLQHVGREIVEALDGLPFSPDGPLWYRGTARCHPYTEAETLDAILDGLGASRVAVGHTPTQGRRIASRNDGRVLLIDSGMNVAAYRGRPAALIIEGGELRTWYAGEGESDVEAQPNRVWDRPYGLSDAELEDFLRTAEVTRLEALAGSDDGRRLVTLEKNGRRLMAVFNARDTAPGLREHRWTRRAERADRYIHEVAAYRLDRLLELEMVPVTVERQIGDEVGALRLWIENGFSEHERQQRPVPFRGDCELQAEYDLMGVFDVLILNPSPQLGLLRYDPRWTIWLMDQSRAFGSSTDIAATLRRSGLELTPQMAGVLARVTPEAAAFLSEYLHDRQVRALVERAARLRSRQ